MSGLILSCVLVLSFVWGKQMAHRGACFQALNHSAQFKFWNLLGLSAILGWSALFSKGMDYLPLSWYPLLPQIFWMALHLCVYYILGLYLGLIVFNRCSKHAQATSTRHVVLLGGLGLLSILAMHTVRNYLTAPIPQHEMRVRLGPGRSILQSTRVTCIPAALANVLPHFGLQCTERECARLLKTTRFGTRESDLILGLNQMGLQGERVAVAPEDLRALKGPAIVKIWRGRARHALAVFGVDRLGWVILIDPSLGPVRMNPETYRQALVDGKGVVITAKPELRLLAHQGAFSPQL